MNAGARNDGGSPAGLYRLDAPSLLVPWWTTSAAPRASAWAGSPRSPVLSPETTPSALFTPDGVRLTGNFGRAGLFPYPLVHQAALPALATTTTSRGGEPKRK